MDDKKQNESPKKPEKEPETLNGKIMRGIKKHRDRNAFIVDTILEWIFELLH